MAIMTPIALPAAVATDLFRWILRRKPWMSVRLIAFAYIYLFAEVGGVIALGLIWIFTLGGLIHRPFMDATYAVQRNWASALLKGAQVIFSLRLEVEGEELVAPGPIIVLARHASIVDNLLPAELVTARHGIRLRYILKQELLADPALDIGGNRLPNYFVDRNSADSRQELGNIEVLAANLGRAEGVLIFPEGTRHTPARRDRALAKLRASGSPFAELAAGLRHLLPPKVGGISALIEAAPGADVVLLGHRGLEGFARIADLWRGGLVGRVIHAKFWRIPSADVPTDRDARARWLFDQWSSIDAWISDGLESDSTR